MHSASCGPRKPVARSTAGEGGASRARRSTVRCAQPQRDEDLERRRGDVERSASSPHPVAKHPDLLVEPDAEVVSTADAIERLADRGKRLETLAILDATHLDNGGNRCPVFADEDSRGHEP